MSILDHLGIIVSDFTHSRTFYDRALAALEITPVMTYGLATGYGRGPKPDFWISQSPAATANDRITAVHACLATRSRAEVDAFHAAALAAGGRDRHDPAIGGVSASRSATGCRPVNRIAGTCWYCCCC